MARPSVAAAISVRVIEFAEERGASREELLAQAGIDPVLLEDLDARIPLTQHAALLRTAKTMCNDPAFALHYGEAVNLAEVSVVGLIGYACETMFDAFVQLQRYSRLMMDFGLGMQPRFALASEPDGLWLEDNRPDPNSTPELTETVFAQMVSGTRRFGDTPFVLAVEVTHAEPGYAHEYERVLGAPVNFRCARNRMRIDENWLTRRVEAQPKYAFAILARHADEMLAELDRLDSFAARVEQMLLAKLHTGDVGIATMAAQLGLSRDTLYRRLKREGVTYEGLVAAVRHRMALDYLAGDRVSVSETAYLLGFSDPAAFSRAFRRWTGRSPRDYRRAANQGE